MPTSKVLYHFTCIEYLPKIIEAGRITKTCSNLLRPKNPIIVDNKLIDPETDGYKPVVWLTDLADSSEANQLGIAESMYKKNRIRIAIPKKPYVWKWSKWAKQYNMDPQWRKDLTAGMRWQHWYISEREILLDEVSEILDTKSNTVINWKNWEPTL